MHKLFAAAFAALMAMPALADDASPVAAPPVDADPTALILFALLFVAMIGGFAGYIWLKERARKEGGVKRPG